MKNKISKGFFFYLFMLILILLAVSFTCLAIMVIWPGKDILGISYYSEFREEIINNIDNKDINFSNVKQINITAIGANVFVESGKRDQKAYVKYVYAANGFTTDSSSRDFKVEYSFDGETLNIVSKEPSGFLKLTDNSKITIYLPTDQTLINTVINFQSEHGSLNFGGEYRAEFEANKVFAKEIKMKTKSGDFTISQHGSSNFENFTFDAESSGFDVATELAVSGSLNIGCGSGKIKIPSVKCDVFNLTTHKSLIEIGNIAGNVVFKGEYGNVYLGNISGYFNATENVKNSILNLKNINGQLLVADADNAKIIAGDVLGDVKVKVKSGKVELKKLFGKAEIESTSGEISFTRAETNVNNIKILTDNGTIKINFDKILAINDIQSKYGRVEFSFGIHEVYTLEILAFDKNKVKFNNFGIDESLISGDTYKQAINGGTEANKLLIKTGGNIEGSRIEKNVA